MDKQTNKTGLIFAITCFIIVTSNVFSDIEEEDASDDSKTTFELPPYVVVATRTPVPLNQVSPSVSYISKEEMIRNQDRSLVDVLKRQPGLVLNSNGARGSLTGLFTRGTESNHTSFFLDGRRLNPTFSNQFDLEFLPIDNLSSVQIQRGPSSVNFGSAGIGGVVSLQTQSDLGESTESIAAEAEYGSYDYSRGAVNASFADEAWAFSIGTSALTTENKRNNDNFDILSANSRFEYKLTKHLVAELIGFITDSDKELPGSVNSPSDTDFSKTQSWLISPGLRFKNDDWSGHIFYSSSKQFLEGFAFSEVKNSVRSDEIYAQIDYSGLENVLFSIGGLYRNDEARDTIRSFLENLGQSGLWTQIQWQLTENCEVRLGGRYDEYTDFDSSANGSIEVLYSFPDLGTAVFAKLANSYAPPSAQDINFDGNLRDGVTVNTSLQPEESESYEIGVRQSAFRNVLNGSIVFFRNEIENLILGDFVFGPAPDFIPVTNDTFNIGHATTEGIEFAVNYEPLERLSLSCNYAYLVAINDDTGERLLRRPRHAVQLNVDYQLTNAIFASVRGNGYFDRKDIEDFSVVDHEDYFIVDMLTDYKVTEQLNLFARVENLLDETYDSVLGFPALGRTGYIGARFSF